MARNGRLGPVASEHPGPGSPPRCPIARDVLYFRWPPSFRVFQLLEINSHSLFSKWFSESGKLVLKMFQSVQALLDQPDCFVIVLIGRRATSAVTSAVVRGGNQADGSGATDPGAAGRSRVGAALPRRSRESHRSAAGVAHRRRAVGRCAGTRA